MKQFLLLLLSLLSLNLLAQQRNFVIDWGGNSSEEKQRSVPGASSSPEKNGRLLLSKDATAFYDTWEDNGFAESSSLQITNVRYGSVSEAELKKVNTAEIPSNIQAEIKTSRARDRVLTSFSISPIIKQNGTYQKILSFSLDYSRRTVPQSRNPRMAIQNSVLASGNWFKFKVEETGIYKITYDFLSDLGMDVSSLNPRNLKIFGDGGKSLPLLVDENEFFDPPQNAIQVVGEEDGTFDSGDYILFYGIGTRGWSEENQSHINPYSDDAYYFITADGGAGLRVQPMNEPTGAASTVITNFNDRHFFEEDEYSPSLVGRRWFGNRFDIENDQTFDFEIPNIDASVPAEIIVRAASVSESVPSMAVSINGTSVDPLSFGSTSQSNLLSEDERIYTLNSPTAAISLNLVYNNAGNPSSVGYLDYIAILSSRQLSGFGEQFGFRYNEASTLSGIGEYQITNASDITQVWDVTNRGFVTSKSNSEAASVISFKAQLGELREYVAVHASNYYAPVSIAQPRLINQNLKGTIFNNVSGNPEDVDYLIVAPSFMIQPALKLANHHENVNSLNVKVVTLEKIYNEFSTGKQDVSAIRNFVKYVYDNAPSPNNRIKYLCLFGDTSVDYKNRLNNNNNIVPTFHRLASNSASSSYMSDDFFGSVDNNEGTIGSSQDVDMLDIAVGRILADEVSTANQMVEKIINYDTKPSFGNWRNNFVLISDDVDEAWEYGDLEVTLDALGDRIGNEKPFINVKKIHSDAFQQETSAGGNRYPQVNEAIKDNIDVGALVITYLGHGGEDGLAKEFIYTKPLAESLQNKNKYTCFVTVTCEFTKFDNPLRYTAGELTYQKPESGAITLLTTTRSIGVDLGVDFNEVLAPYLFGFETSNYPTPAEALRLAKNELGANEPNRRVIFCVGDPAMGLAFPKERIELTTLNDVPIAQTTDTLQALSKVKFGGRVVDPSGNLLSDYNGILEAKIFDKYVNRQTLGNDGVRDSDGNLLILNFITLGEGLFNGQATVTNGEFEFEFVVPRDIQIPVGNGRVSLYSQHDSKLEDQTGVNLNIQVGGINENAPEDTQGPTIELFMNDESFVTGGVTNDSPILLAKMHDENGMNTASGIGHDMIAILDGDEANPYVVNEYYQAEVDDYTRGDLSYQLRDLEEGLHTLTFKAWDVYNNSSTAEIQFIVAGDDELEITRVLNYPNPFVDYTEFWFNHNRPFEPLQVQVQVFTVTGKVVWTQNQIINTDGFLSRDIVWNGRDDFGDKIGKGVYVYKITVKSTLTNQQVEKFEKLVIL